MIRPEINKTRWVVVAKAKFNYSVLEFWTTKNNWEKLEVKDEFFSPKEFSSEARAKNFRGARGRNLYRLLSWSIEFWPKEKLDQERIQTILTDQQHVNPGWQG